MDKSLYRHLIENYPSDFIEYVMANHLLNEFNTTEDVYDYFLNVYLEEDNNEYDESEDEVFDMQESYANEANIFGREVDTELDHNRYFIMDGVEVNRDDFIKYIQEWVSPRRFESIMEKLENGKEVIIGHGLTWIEEEPKEGWEPEYEKHKISPLFEAVEPQNEKYFISDNETEPDLFWKIFEEMVQLEIEERHPNLNTKEEKAWKENKKDELSVGKSLFVGNLLFEIK